MESVLDRFLRYVTIDTKADPESDITPSSAGQLAFGAVLLNELTRIGMAEAKVDANGYVTALLPSNTDKELPVVGFIAHLDTSPDFDASNVKPKLVKNYSGGDIVLNSALGIVLKPDEFPELELYLGNDIVTTDGTTLLGADDKAGVAEIMAAMDFLVQHPEIQHGNIRVCFTPDEEIGQGADHFDVAGFGAHFAYTIDGGQIGELEYENFNAALAKVTIHGRNVHPGYAKNKMVNALLVANRFVSLLPYDQTPQTTEGYEGFFHLHALKGDVEQCDIQLLVRDFSVVGFEERKRFLVEVVETLNAEWGLGTVDLDLKDQYQKHA
jgi:tripeptide aminopeptidase